MERCVSALRQQPEAHDGSSAICRWLEHLLTIPGGAVTVAAGNAGHEGPESTDDIGFIMGRIHTSGRIAARGLENEIELVVVGNGTIDVSENELEIWYSSADRLAVSVKPPGGRWIGPIQPRQFIENRQIFDKSFVSIYNEIYHPANGASYIGVYLSPFFSDTQIIGITPGLWRVRLCLDARHSPQRVDRTACRTITKTHFLRVFDCVFSSDCDCNTGTPVIYTTPP